VAVGLRVQQNQEPEGTEMAVQLSQAYLEWERVTRNEAKLEGILEGRLGAKLETVPALLKRGLSAEEIAQILELTVEQVQSVKP
jgi:predicted transposase/invertase (TIGR01784 family)